MATETLIIVVGGDYLAYEICREILKTAGQRVALIWKHEEERARRLLASTAVQLSEQYPHTFDHYNLDPSDAHSLRDAGLDPPDPEATQPNYCLVAVSSDDRLNLRVSLLARDINDRIRVTIRQFNPVLGHKIQEGLRYNCTAISPAAHAAATYAASGVDRSCFYALPFPTLETLAAKSVKRKPPGEQRDLSGPESDAGLFGFCERTAADFGIDGMTVEEAELHLRARVVAINGKTPYLCHAEEDHADMEMIKSPIAENEEVCVWPDVPNQDDLAKG